MALNWNWDNKIGELLNVGDIVYSAKGGTRNESH